MDLEFTTWVEENITNGNLKVAEAEGTGRAAESFITNLNLFGGEAGALRLFRGGGYAAIASDDSKFISLLEGLGVSYMTPAALIIYLLRRKQIGKDETFQYLDRIKAFISPEEFVALIEALREEK